MEDKIQELIESCMLDIVIKIKRDINNDLEVSLSYMDHEFSYDTISLDEIRDAE